MVRNVLVGATGTYYVAAELSKIGFIVLLTTRNTEGIDILVSNPANYKTASVQVKTTRKKDYWMMGRKDEKSSRNLTYVFVDLRKEPPKYYVVPSGKVAKSIRERHKQWMAKKEMKRSRKSDKLRKFHLSEAEAQKYRKKWNLLKIGLPS